MSDSSCQLFSGTQHASDNHLAGYFSLHRLFLWAIITYPEIQEKIDNKLTEFIDNEDMRSKNKCPHIGEWLMLLSGSSKYRFVFLCSICARFYLFYISFAENWISALLFAHPRPEKMSPFWLFSFESAALWKLYSLVIFFFFYSFLNYQWQIRNGIFSGVRIYYSLGMNVVRECVLLVGPLSVAG